MYLKYIFDIIYANTKIVYMFVWWGEKEWDRDKVNKVLLLVVTGHLWIELCSTLLKFYVLLKKYT